jgi:hypothetical protein
MIWVRMKARAKKRRTRRSATKASSIDVMRARVTMLIADSRGSMPVTMACRNAEKAVVACRLLERRNGPICLRNVEPMGLSPRLTATPRMA